MSLEEPMSINHPAVMNDKQVQAYAEQLGEPSRRRNYLAGIVGAGMVSRELVDYLVDSGQEHLLYDLVPVPDAPGSYRINTVQTEPNK